MTERVFLQLTLLKLTQISPQIDSLSFNIFLKNRCLKSFLNSKVLLTASRHDDLIVTNTLKNEVICNKMNIFVLVWLNGIIEVSSNNP
jgi:hypothetical protein